MTCEEVRDQLHPYFDGELPEAQVRQLESALADCPDCQADLDELIAMRAMMTEALVEPIREVDLSGFADQVLQRIETEEEAVTAPPVTAAEEPALLDQLMAWFTPPRLAGAFAVALAALVFLWPGATSDPVEDAGVAETVADSSRAGTKEKNRRRPMEIEASPQGRHAATVESWEVAQGRVKIDQNADDPSMPLVVWHIIDEEGAPSGDTGL